MRKILTSRQVAEALGVSESSVKRWCDAGILPFHRTAGGHRRLAPGDVIGFVRDQGHSLTAPEILGLPVAADPARPVADLTARLLALLESGQEDAVRTLLIGQYLAGQPLHRLCDEAIAPAFQRMGHHWQDGVIEVYQERRACEICVRVLMELRQMVPTLPHDAPYALGGTLSGDPYCLPTLMAELVLREAGWRADSFGIDLPLATLVHAVRDQRPRLVWLSLSVEPELEPFVEQYRSLYETAQARSTAIVVGGRGLSDPLRCRIDALAGGDRIGRLTAIARLLVPPRPDRADRD